LCISGEKVLQTVWNEIPFEIEDLYYLNLTQDTVWNTARTREMDRPLTQEEVRRVQVDQSKAVNVERKILADATGWYSGPPT
jgi:hypothetical protein